MLNQYINDLAIGMWEFNGQSGDWEDYKYFAYQGIWNSNNECLTSILPVAEYNVLKEKFQNLEYNIDLSSCE